MYWIQLKLFEIFLDSGTMVLLKPKIQATKINAMARRLVVLFK